MELSYEVVIWGGLVINNLFLDLGYIFRYDFFFFFKL